MNHLNQQNGDSGVMALGILGVAILFGVCLLYDQFRGPINSVFIFFNRVELFLFSLISPKANYVYVKLGAANPAQFTWDQITNQVEFVGRYVRFPIAIILFGMGIHSLRSGVASNYTRTMTMELLIKENAKTFPCMTPIVGKNLLQEPLDVGPWRTARSPLQFCAEHGLILDGETPVPSERLINSHGLPNEQSFYLGAGGPGSLRLDRQKAERVFRLQLGDRLVTPSALPDYMQGLAAAFLALGHGDKEVGQALLDQMSESYQEYAPGETGGFSWRPPFWRPGHPERPCFVDVAGAAELLEKYAATSDAQFHTAKHAGYATTWCMSLLAFARRKGVVASSQFIWLRPTDRTLFYALNQMGGRTAWSEAAGPWAHYLAEESSNSVIEEPEVSEGITALEQALREQGWLPARRKDRS